MSHEPDATSPALVGPVNGEPLPGSGDPAGALCLTDFLDVDTLAMIQESFTSLTRLSTVIRDCEGVVVSQPDPAARQRQDEILGNLVIDQDLTSIDGQPLVAPITVEGQNLGAIVIDSGRPAPPPDAREVAPLVEKLRSLGVGEQDLAQVVSLAQRTCAPSRAAAVQFLYLMANSIARLCYQEYQLRQRVEHQELLYKLSRLLAASKSLQQTLDTAARSAAQLLNCKACSIRLINEAGTEMRIRAVYNLSKVYLDKGPMLVRNSAIYQEAVTTGDAVYVQDMATDERVSYRDDAKREGLVSMLTAAMVYQGRPIGLIRLYTGAHRRFSKGEKDVMRAMAQLLAAAIENAKLDADRQEAVGVQRQLRLAVAVQRRMLPAAPPHVPPFEIAARYVPSFDLGGDFYDFIDLDGHVGIAVGDVVGKGIAASLLMASVRASLRAFAQDVYDIDEIISRVNVALTRDTLDNEFATLFYGVLDPQTLRLTYCSAGHEPALLLRQGRFTELSAGGMIVGVDAQQVYEKGLVDLKPGDMLVIFTDGLVDAVSFSGQRFGRERIRRAILEAAKLNAGDAMSHLLWEMRRFVGLNRSADDTTIVVIKVVGPAVPPARA